MYENEEKGDSVKQKIFPIIKQFETSLGVKYITDRSSRLFKLLDLQV